MSSLDVRAIDEKALRHKPCPGARHEFRVLLSEQAFDRAVARGDSDTTREIGGVLVGDVFKDDAGPYLLIESTVDALHAEEKGAELTFTHATWEHIHKEMDGKHQGKRVVGWYHTHPGFGVFLSDRDQFIHKSFFNLPFQVALVYDPKTHEHGLFTWHDNEVRRARRYWIGAREHLWDGPRTPEHQDRKAPGPEAPVAPPADDHASRATGSRDESLTGLLLPLALIGVVVLVIGGFVGHWFGVGSANQALAQAQIEIAKAKTEGAQLTLTSLQSDLVAILRNTLGDEALRRPLTQAIAEIERALAVVPDVAPTAGPGPAAPPGAGAGSAAGAGAGSATGAGSAATGSAAGASTPTVAAGSSDERLRQLASQLRATRETLLRLAQDRGSAQAQLEQLERLARLGNEVRGDLGRDVAEQRLGLGALYAELAADAVKANDPARARRLLTTAAHLDPRNRARYEKQLQSFDRSAKLPPDSDRTGSPGEGRMR
jgi:proteasome lid subunit RPN8/RPN11